MEKKNDPSFEEETSSDAEYVVREEKETSEQEKSSSKEVSEEEEEEEEDEEARPKKSKKSSKAKKSKKKKKSNEESEEEKEVKPKSPKTKKSNEESKPKKKTDKSPKKRENSDEEQEKLSEKESKRKSPKSRKSQSYVMKEVSDDEKGKVSEYQDNEILKNVNIQAEDLELKNEGPVKEHLFSIEHLEKKFGIQIKKDVNASRGLDSNEAASRLTKFGPNALTPPKETPEFIKFLKQFLNFFMLLLIFAGILSIITYAIDHTQILNVYLGIIIFGVVIFTCAMAYFQERSSSNVIKSFQKLLPQNCKVIRNGQAMKVKPSDLVIGDLVKLGTGDKVPADLRLLHVSSFKVEQASLTGEPEPIECFIDPQSENPLEAKNLIFNSCLVIEGEAIGVVIRTGDETFIGSIAKQSTSAKHQDTPLKKEIRRFVYFVTILSIISGIILLITGLAQGQSFVFVFVNGFIVIILGNIPEGLPATLTTCLTIVAKRLAKENVLVKQLECVETLGSATLIASDKTGTLTENRMTVQNLWFDLRAMSASDVFRLEDEMHQSKTFKKIYHIAGLCNRAYFSVNEEELRRLKIPVNEDVAKKSIESKLPLRFSSEWKRSMERRRAGIVGDASETALLAFVDKFKPVDPTRQKYRKVFEVPFNSKIKYQLSIHEKISATEPGPYPRLLVIKGAPEIIINRCSHHYYEGKKKKMDANFMKEYEKIYQQLGKLGERVLGLAFTELPPDPKSDYGPGEKPDYPENGYIFAGLVSLVDPPKQGVKEAIDKCHTAGIKVLMITGDHPFTAEAIARKVGIIQDGATREELAKELKIPPDQVEEDLIQAAVIPGSQLDNLTEEQWDVICSKKELVFARTTPQHKVMIVEHFQKRGEVVAVTGDGVNDSIALKRADIGVAMGLRGSDVAKEAAKIVLLDDNFASIVKAIEEGRVLFDNLKKTICYTVSHSVPELVPIIMTLTVGVPLALYPLLVLTIDLGTELAPAISLAYEKAESDIMSRPPRDSKKDRLVSASTLLYSYLQIGLIEGIAGMFAFFAVFWYFGLPPSSLVQVVNHDYFQVDTTVNYEYNGQVFTPDTQRYITAVADGAYYITVVGSQLLANIWMCKTRNESLFTHGIRNIVLNYGVLFSLCLMIIFVYVPDIQNFFSANVVPIQFWIPLLVSAIIIWVYCETRKYFTRKYPTKNALLKLLSW